MDIIATLEKEEIERLGKKIPVFAPGDTVTTAMGGMLTSIPDLSRYVGAFLAAWPPRDGPESGPVRRASLREMQQPWRPSGMRVVLLVDPGAAQEIAHAKAFATIEAVVVGAAGGSDVPGAESSG